MMLGPLVRRRSPEKSAMAAASPGCDRCAPGGGGGGGCGPGPLPRRSHQHHRHHHHHHHHHVDRVQTTVEEYVLDERDFGGHFQPAALGVPRDVERSSAHQQLQRHVRRSQELRTVSIIETLSELVAGQGDTGKLDDCDGQCQRRLHDGRNSFGGDAVPEVSPPTLVRKPRPADSSSKAKARSDGGGLSSGTKASTCCNDASSRKKPNVVHCEDSASSKVKVRGGTMLAGKTSASCDDARLGKIQSSELSLQRCIHGSIQQCPATAFNQEWPECVDATMAAAAAAAVKTTSACCKNGTSAAAFNRDWTCRKPGNSSRNSSSCSSGQTRATRNAYEDTCPPKMAAIQKVPRSADPGSGPGHRKQCAGVNHDPSHFMISTLRSKGRTPDWIAGIFSIARRGNLERLSQALVGMDATLIRNLSDHRGNNLFHVCCCYGHLDSLQWLMQRGKQCEDAILDENKYELTPLVCAVKYGKLPCVEWLIQNTIARGQLAPSTGIRPLLHWAAKYGQEVILCWLAEYMERNSMDVNVKDGHGNTALHLAAKHGHAVSIKALVIHRCDASLRNDIGYKASDYAALYGQAACSEYLLCLEACLLLSSDVATLDADIYSSRAEMSKTKIQFKDVLSCAKKLVKEREELSLHLDRLQDGLVHLNDVIVAAIRGLCEENARLREKTADDGGRRQSDNAQSIDETVALCHAMQTRWKDGQQRWLSPSALSEIQQKILLAEERWKRARGGRTNWGDKECKERIAVFRERLAQVRCQSAGIRLSEIRSISSSESSLASMEDATSDYEERNETCASDRPFSPPVFAELEKRRLHPNPRAPVQPPPPPRQSGSESRAYPGLSTKSSPLKTSQKSGRRMPAVPSLASRSQETGSGGGGSHRVSRNFDVGLVSQGTCKVLEVIVSSGNESENGTRTTGDDVVETVLGFEQPWTMVGYPEASVLDQVAGLKTYPNGTQHRSKRTKSGVVAMATATRGHCKSDVFECRDDDDDNDDSGGGVSDEEDPKRSSADRQRRNKMLSCEDKLHVDKLDTTRSNEGQSTDNDGLDEHPDNPLSEIFEEFRIVTPPVTCPMDYDNNGKLVSSEPDLIIGTKCIRGSKHPPTDTLPIDISPIVAKSESVGCTVDSGLILADEGDSNPMETTGVEFGSSPSVNPESADELDPDDACVGATPSGRGNPLKRRGFLQKLNLRWPSKRKSRSAIAAAVANKVREISAENFRETYLHVRNGDATTALPDDSTVSNDNVESLVSDRSVETSDPATTSVNDNRQQESNDSISEKRASLVFGNRDDGSVEATRESDVSSSSSRGSLLRAATGDGSNADETRSSSASLGSAQKKQLTIDLALGSSPASLGFSRIGDAVSQCRSDTHSDSNSCRSIPAAPTGPRNIPIPPLPFDAPAVPGSQSGSESQKGFNYTLPKSGASSRNIPVPPLPVETSMTDLGSQQDIESVSESHNGYSYIMPPKSTSTRSIPVPPLPAEPRLDIVSQNDSESVSESRNGYSYITMHGSGSQNRQSRSNFSREDDEDEDDDDDDDDDGDEEQKDSSRPEADQDISSLDKALDILDKDQCNLIHAQANMPPQRPLSCGGGGRGGAKSEQGGDGGGFLSRPESSVSSVSYSAVFRIPGYPLRKVSSGSTDLLTPDSLTPSRMSPAPSEVSKTESALSPPSDISKTESVRHMRQLTRIEENKKKKEKEQHQHQQQQQQQQEEVSCSKPVLPALPMKRLTGVKVAAIVDIHADSAAAAALKQTATAQREGGDDEVQTTTAREAKILTVVGSQLETDNAMQGKRGGTAAASNGKGCILVPDVSNVACETKTLSKEKPWYELSDDEEILMPETLKRNVGLAKSSSEEDNAYLCA